ncbi:Recombinase [compost metagenome]
MIAKSLSRLGRNTVENLQTAHANQSSVSVILKNIVYIGTLVHHREETRDFISKKRRLVDPSEQIVHENAHPAIITMDEHLAVLEKMKKKGSNKSNGSEKFIRSHCRMC